MTTYVPTPVEPGEANNVAAEKAREQGQSLTPARRPRRGALVFVSGFMLGAITGALSFVGGRRRMPFVVGNRNVFMSLPFSGISMVAPMSRGRGRGRRRRMNRFAAWGGGSRSRRRGR